MTYIIGTLLVRSARLPISAFRFLHHGQSILRTFAHVFSGSEPNLSALVQLRERQAHGSLYSRKRSISASVSQSCMLPLCSDGAAAQSQLNQKSNGPRAVVSLQRALAARHQFWILRPVPSRHPPPPSSSGSTTPAHFFMRVFPRSAQGDVVRRCRTAPFLIGGWVGGCWVTAGRRNGRRRYAIFLALERPYFYSGLLSCPLHIYLRGLRQGIVFTNKLTNIGYFSSVGRHRPEI